jgi:hypothetical protein
MDSDGLRAYAKGLEALDDIALAQAAAGWRADTAEHRVCMDEITRRAKKGDRRVAWLAVLISVASLVVSIIALAMHRS